MTRLSLYVLESLGDTFRDSCASDRFVAWDLTRRSGIFVTQLAIRCELGAAIQCEYQQGIYNKYPHSSSISSALRTFERYVFLSLRTCTGKIQQDGRVVQREACVPQLELVRSS